MDTVDKINNLSKSDFISTFGNIFEKTDWIAEKAYDSKPFNNLNELFSIMMEIFEKCKKDVHLEILNAHPDLAVEKKLTEDSKKEQNDSNLNECSDQEFKEFMKLNIDYKKRFSFPFIIAVKGKKKQKILNIFRKRITKNINLEFEESIKQVKKIASIRLEQIIKNN